MMVNYWHFVQSLPIHHCRLKPTFLLDHHYHQQLAQVQLNQTLQKKRNQHRHHYHILNLQNHPHLLKSTNFH